MRRVIRYVDLPSKEGFGYSTSESDPIWLYGAWCAKYVQKWQSKNPHLELVDYDILVRDHYLKITAQPKMQKMVCNIARKGTDFYKESAEHTVLTNEAVNNFADNGWNLEGVVTAVSSSVDHANDHIIMWAIISTLTFVREVAPPTPSIKN